jgi:glutamyl-tRNA reductase
LEDLDRLVVCSEDTTSLHAADFDRARAAALAHDATLVVTCQRIETIALDPCPLDCPEQRTGLDAFRYLASLAAGLHSIALGEHEILGQVRHAADDAPPPITAIIARAIAAARAFRKRHRFDADAGTLLLLSLERLPRPRSLLVLGSGPTAAAISRAAGRLELDGVTVASRACPAWLPRRDTTWYPLNRLADLPAHDLAVVALGGDAPTLPAAAVPARDLLDLSTPRRTDPADPRVTTLRDLRTAAGFEGRAPLFADLDRDIDRVLSHWSEDAGSPVGRFRRAVELRRSADLDRIARRHPEIPRQVLETITRSLVAHILHEPSERLRALDPTTAHTVAAIFEQPEKP